MVPYSVRDNIYHITLHIKNCMFYVFLFESVRLACHHQKSFGQTCLGFPQTLYVHFPALFVHQFYTYTHKKRHEVMCSCPFTCRYRQTPLLERIAGEHISRLKVCLQPQAGCLRTMHTRQAKAYNAHPPALNLANLQVRTLSQCFSCLQLSLSKVGAKIQTFLDMAK